MFRDLFARWLTPTAAASDLMQFGSEAIWFDQMYGGVAVLGATGSGKTSFLELLLQALAEHPARPGILWCCAKSDEADRAAKVARRAGRSAAYSHGPASRAGSNARRGTARQRGTLWPGWCPRFTGTTPAFGPTV